MKCRNALCFKILILFVPLMLAACATGLPLARYAPVEGAREDFVFCHGYGCRLQQQTGIDEREWRSVQQIFSRKPAKTAQEERSKIAAAIGRIEKIIGPKTATDNDRAEAARLREDTGQLDCIDETVNTHRYLGFLETDGLLRFHKRVLPIHRGYFIDGSWPHNAAMIEEIETQQDYVVDSFYGANGDPAHIVPRDEWLDGWRPDQPAP